MKRKYPREWLRKVFIERPELHGQDLRKLKEHARQELYQAVHSGEVTKPNACETCGRVVRLEAHHESYYEPLKVQWLCKRCHGKVWKGSNMTYRERQRRLDGDL